MRLTKNTVKHEVETTETVCQITQDKFDKICAETAAKTIANFVGDDPEVEDLIVGIQLTSLFAQFVAKLDKKLFDEADKTENPDNNEKEEK